MPWHPPSVLEYWDKLPAATDARLRASYQSILEDLVRSVARGGQHYLVVSVGPEGDVARGLHRSTAVQEHVNEEL